MATYEVRGAVLPEREARTLWIDGDLLRTEPVANAEVVVDGGWLVPGLVDTHTHPVRRSRPTRSTRTNCGGT
jgi:imidazolonepropionase-like amidohydrolase